ncbi:MAG TPA: N-formylglutamate amidohydrolase [Rhodobacteraceae bacterium]|jgi:predicted N-formylglutamate amidohydrolase|nr:N-formylglutamate amidohydrolase [Paracoccaceae bacterium]
MTYHPYHIFGENRPSRWLITADHAANTIPPDVNGGDLGLPAADMARHIAFDPGSAGLTCALAELLDAPAILSNFSRLVIDPNRGEDDPTLLMKLYDGTIIPANRHADAKERERRLKAYYRPYHTALAELSARRNDTLYVSIHSYTPQLAGRPKRPWHVGILYANDTRLSAPLVDRLRQEPDLCVGENEPYGGHLRGDSVDKHALAHNRPNVLIEIRNDLIKTDEQQVNWAKRLAPMLEQALIKSRL